VGRNLTGARFDAEDLAEQRLGVLSVAERIAFAAAIASRDIELTVGAKLQLTAVVVRLVGVGNAEDRLT
jgi:hypothetical protein